MIVPRLFRGLFVCSTGHSGGFCCVPNSELTADVLSSMELRHPLTLDVEALHVCRHHLVEDVILSLVLPLSSKTVVLEMAIARLLHESGMHLGNRKIIYIAPIKVRTSYSIVATIPAIRHLFHKRRH